MSLDLLSAACEAIKTGSIERASAAAREYLNSNPVLGEMALASRLGDVQVSISRADTVNLYMIGSYTLEPLVPFVQAWGVANALFLNARVGPFGQYWQEILSAESPVYSTDTDVVFLALRAEDLVPDLEFRPTYDVNKVGSIVEDLAGQVEAMVKKIRERSRVKIIVQGFDISRCYAGGLIAFQGDNGTPWIIRECNLRIANLARAAQDVVYLDTEAMVANVGPQWYSESNWFTSANPLSGYGLRELARNLVRAVVAMRGKTKKCIVVDLDNTLWGGIIGEDGPHGIKVGHSYPGNNYSFLQRWLKAMEGLGFILAINSKNEESLVREVLSTHPGMVLRDNDFALILANWNDKASNIREIAARLNIGTDTLVFIDDSPAELDLIMQAYPEVACCRMDEMPVQVIRSVTENGGLDKLTITDEDRSRTAMYLAQERRAKLEASSDSLEEFLRNLQMRAVIGTVDSGSVDRVAQLTQKTNQFNLTTRRYTPGEIQAMAKDPDYRVFWLELEDKFGSNGIVGVAIIRVTASEWRIDTLLLSCRVMGRTVEDAFVRAIADVAWVQGATALIGEYIPTKRNSVVRGLYQRLGFVQIGESGNDGVTLWKLELPAKNLGTPYVTVEMRNEVSYKKEETAS
ncbi:MAG TPA: HAD-IIIC family phosphatase [Firmicutes bacterium]|nr:HAD-IIIC family phosphatase [Bacillota bacterium]